MANVFIDMQHTHTHRERERERKGGWLLLIPYGKLTTDLKGEEFLREEEMTKKKKTVALLKHIPACMTAHQSRKPGASGTTCRQLNRLKNVVSVWHSWPEPLPGSSAGLHFI